MRCAVAALLCAGVLAGISPRHAASPSVPRGMSPHVARWMASAVCRVCRGGGVVASLVDDVEYDVWWEFNVVVVCTKRTKDKEKHYLKTSAR